MLAEFFIGLKFDAVACRRSAAMEDARFQPCACLSNPIASRGYGRRPIGLQKITLDSLRSHRLDLQPVWQKEDRFGTRIATESQLCDKEARADQFFVV